MGDFNEKAAFAIGDVEIRRVGSTTVIGELHAYRPGLDITEVKHWRDIGNLADNAKHVVIEQSSTSGDSYWQRTYEDAANSYMRLAEVNGKINGTMSPLTPAQGFEVQDKVNEYRIAGLAVRDIAVLAMDAAVSSSIWGIPDDMSVVANITPYMPQLLGRDTTPDDIGDFIGLLKLFRSSRQIVVEEGNLDSLVRERLMQRELTQIEGVTEDSMILVGARHVEGMVKTLQNPSYRTEVKTTERLKKILTDYTNMDRKKFWTTYYSEI